uniref:Peptidase_M16_C domain-containing protein n=2 Tax=Macrostomum lignano TaxID=282301 RepID=A0A1I8JA03_9PLAT
MTDSKQTNLQPLVLHSRVLSRFEIDTPSQYLNHYIRQHRAIELPNGAIAFLSHKPDDFDDDSSSSRSSSDIGPANMKSGADDESNVFYDNVENDTTSCDKESSADCSLQRSRFALVCFSIGVGRLHEPSDCRGLAELCLRLIFFACNHPQMQSLESSFDDTTVQTLDESIWNQESHYHAEVFDDRSECSFVVDSDKKLRSKCLREGLPPLDLLERSSGNPDHPFNRLVLDNANTVASIGSEDVKKRLFEFHAKYYSAKLLRMALVCSKPLDELEEIFVEAFESLPGEPVPRIRFNCHPYDGSYGLFKLEILQHSRDCVSPARPESAVQDLARPVRFVDAAKKRQQCSLEACLHRHGLGFCDVGLLDRGTLGFDSFHICIRGMKNVRDSEDRAITAVFRYLAMLRKLGPQEWLFEEARLEGQKALDVGLNDWEYYPFVRSNICLQRYPMQDLLRAHRVPCDYSPTIISEFLNLLTPDRCKVYVFEAGVNKNCPTVYGQSCPHSGAVPHSVKKLDPDLLAVCKADWPSPSIEFDADLGFPQPTPVDCLAESVSISQQDDSLALSRIARRHDKLLALPSSDCSFHVIELTNGVQAILASRNSFGGQESNEKSLVCATLGIGRLHDPTDFRGLAELCHRLTLVGSKSTPQTFDGLNDLLLDNSCEENVEYAMGVHDDQSVYKFTVPASLIPESLFRLGCGLVNPEINNESVERELLSGQFRRQILAQDWLERCSGNLTHPYNRMAKGAQKTIRSYTSEEIKTRLIAFFNENYSANLLKLAIVDSRSLDELEKLVAAHFGSMRNLSINQLKISTHPYEGTLIGVKVRSNCLSLGRKLYMVFPLPEQTKLHLTSPDMLVSYLINNRCKGSISDCLERRHLSTNVFGQLVNRGSVGFDSYCVTVFHQNKELEMAESENKIITIVFRYLAMLRQIGPLEWLYNTFRVERRKGQTFDDENSSTGPRWKLNPLQYYCDQLLECHMQRYPLESLFTARYALPEYSPRAITDFLEFLKPDNCKVFVSGLGTDESHMCTFLSPDGKLCCEPDGPNFCSMEKLKPELIATCSAAWPSSSCEFDTELKLPKQNLFLCSDFSLRPDETTDQQPPGLRLLRFEAGPHTPAARFWFQQDNRLQTPIVFISVDLVTSPEPLVTDCASSVMLDIFVVLLVDQLNSLESQAKQVDLRLKVSRSKQGIQVCCSGYRQPLPSLVAAALSRIFELKITEHAFRKARRKISALEAQKTHKTDLCKSQLAMLLNSACSWHWSYQDKRVAINETTLENFMIFVQRFSSQIQLSSQPQRLVSEDEDEEDKRTDAAVAVMSLWSRISLAEDEEVVEESSALQQTLQEEQDQQQKQQIPRQLFAEILVYGNATAKDAEAASQIILNALPSPTQRTTETTFEAVRRRVYLLPSGSHHVLQLTISANYQRKSGCAVVLQVPKPVPTADTNMGFEDAIRQDCLFYLLIEVLQCRGEMINDPLDRAIKILIQRNYHAYVVTFDVVDSQHPTKIEEQVENYIEKIGDYISSLSEESFLYCLSSMEKSMRKEIPTTVQEQHDSHWRSITHGVLRFDRDANLAKCLDAVVGGIKKDCLLELWRSCLKRGSPNRRKLCIHRISRAAFPDGISEADYADYPGTIIRNRNLFKQSLLLSPLPSVQNLRPNSDV